MTSGNELCLKDVKILRDQFDNIVILGIGLDGGLYEHKDEIWFEGKVLRREGWLPYSMEIL